MPSPRRRLGFDRRRDELLGAAERLLRERGHAVRVEDVTAAANASKGAFYTCFDTWEDLLDTLRERQAAALAGALAGVSGDAADRLAETGRRTVDFILGLGGLHAVLFHGPFTQSRPLAAERRPAAHLARMLSEGQADGGAVDPGLDPGPTGALLFAAIHETADAIEAGAARTPALAALDRLIRRVVAA